MMIDGYEHERIMNNIESREQSRIMYENAINNPTKGNVTVFLNNRDVEINANKIEYDASDRTLKAYNAKDELIAHFSFVMGYVKK